MQFEISINFNVILKATFSTLRHLISELKYYKKHEKIKCNDEILNGNDHFFSGQL
ncbi:hypothetical protein LX77_03727 [Gelidibacter algens]|uniref:Uncharacterized protein n=1 Tax=Gelidibacter algens TaxID=49280 RepID=A0A327RRV3_9FLAO|nr:hypothetical protein LX77_03727 [Gelidibacter algens]